MKTIQLNGCLYDIQYMHYRRHSEGYQNESNCPCHRVPLKLPYTKITKIES